MTSYRTTSLGILIIIDMHQLLTLKCNAMNSVVDLKKLCHGENYLCACVRMFC